MSNIRTGTSQNPKVEEATHKPHSWDGNEKSYWEGKIEGGKNTILPLVKKRGLERKRQSAVPIPVKEGKGKAGKGNTLRRGDLREKIPGREGEKKKTARQILDQKYRTN